MMDQLSNDVRYAMRSLRKSPGFALLAILTLGLGIGANTAIFSVIYGVLLRPLPYADSDRLVLVRQSAPPLGRADVGVSIKEFFTYRDQAADFEGLVEFHQMSFDLLKRGEPDRVNTGVVSPNFFDVLGIEPILGRSFVPQDDEPGAPAVLIVSYSYWQSKFGGDRTIVGQVLEMNDRPHTVVGVLPNVPHFPQENDVYMPTSACPFRSDAQTRIAENPRVFPILNVFGKLKPGVTRERASAAVDTILRRFVADDTGAYRPGAGFAATALDVRAEMTRNARPMLLILLGTTGLILLIACANVANLTLARVLRRDRELAVRAALGAGRGRLVRQLLTESTVLALAGGACGLLFAGWTTGLLTTFVARFTPRTGEIALDIQVLLLTAVVSVLTGLLFGTLPAMASSADLVTAMKQGSAGAGVGIGRRWVQSALVVAQVAVSVVLLAGAALLIASFYRLQRVDPGYNGDRVMSAELFTNFSKYPNVDAQRRFYLPLIERLEGRPGVVSVAVTNAVPLRVAQPGSGAFQIEGRVEDNPERRPTADARIVSAGFFRTLGVPLVAGRTFTESDTADSMRVVVINRAMTRYWDSSEPIGSRISLDAGRTWSTVVGVVGNVRDFGLDRRSSPAVLHAVAADEAESERSRARAHVGRSGIRDRDDSRRGVGARSGDACSERPHARRDSRSLSCHAEADGRAVVGVRRACAGRDDGGHYGRDGDFGVAANPGIRHPHGARREPRRRAPDGHRPRTCAGGRWTRHRCPRVNPRHASARLVPLRHEPARSADVPVRGRGVRACRSRRVHRSGLAGDDGRSDAGGSSGIAHNPSKTHAPSSRGAVHRYAPRHSGIRLGGRSGPGRRFRPGRPARADAGHVFRAHATGRRRRDAEAREGEAGRRRLRSGIG